MTLKLVLVRWSAVRYGGPRMQVGAQLSGSLWAGFAISEVKLDPYQNSGAFSSHKNGAILFRVMILVL